MISNARVIKIIKPDVAMVEVTRETACGSSCSSNCASFKSCSKASTKVTALAKNNKNAEVGDIVSVTSKTSTVILNALIVYVLPIIFFFTGYFATSSLYQTESLKLLGGFISFVISIVFAIIYSKKFASNITIEIV